LSIAGPEDEDLLLTAATTLHHGILDKKLYRPVWSHQFSRRRVFERDDGA